MTDAALREGLESDYSELELCQSSGAWKAVYILAGSIIEALLVDSLVGIVPAADREKLYELTLGPLIDLAKKNGLVSERAANLSHAVRGFRNLIHPGRVVRLSERVDGEGAAVAVALVNMVLAEVVEKRTETYGLTAEQVVSKLQGDPSAIALLRHLLKEMREAERDRLVVDLLPAKYLEARLLGSEDDDLFEDAYTLALNVATDAAKTKAAEQFARVVREEGQAVVRARERLFGASNMALLSDADQQLVKAHLLARLRDGEDAPFGAADGLGPYLTTNEAQSLGLAFARLAPTMNPFRVRQMHSFVTHLPYSLTPEAKAAFEGAIRQAAQRAEGTPGEESLRGLAAALEDIPF